MPATASDSFSSGSILSDTDLETINSEELVIFHSIQTVYSNKKDIVAIYSSGNAVDSSPKDWVGLFKTGWQTMHDFSVYQWAPFSPLHACQPRKRRSVFPHADIQGLFGRFQFLYVTGADEVIGVSDSFDVYDLEPALESSLVQENVPSSLSVISLGSQSSFSDDEKPFESSEEIPSSDASDKPELRALVPRKDNWTLSDFVIGNSARSMFEKLLFVYPSDWNSFLEEYEPVKGVYLSSERTEKCFIEEVPPQNEELASPLSQAGTSTALVVADKTTSRCLPLLSSGPLVFTLHRQDFLSQQTCLRMYHPNLLMSAVEETKRTVPETDSKRQEREELLPCSKWTPQPGPFNLQAIQWSVTDPSALPHSSHEQCDTDLKKEAPEYDEGSVTGFKWIDSAGNEKSSSQSVKQLVQADTDFTRGSETVKQMIPKTEKNTRKKRWVQCSKSKSNRSKQEAMLKEALTLMTKSSPSSTSAGAAASSQNTSQRKSEAEECLFSASGVDSCRKRRRLNTTGITKAKRRRLTQMTSTPTSPAPCSVEDEGYCSLEEEDNNRISLNRHGPGECVELLSLALTEALENNAELRAQLSQVTDRKSKTMVDTSSSAVHQEKSNQCDKPATSGKAMNTEKQKTRNAAANTKKTAKKDTPAQCSSNRKGKAVNTDTRTERHAASNTTAVAKTDTPSQCVTTSAKSVITTPVPPTSDTESNTPHTCEPLSLTQKEKRSHEAQSEILSLDFTVVRNMPLPAPVVEDPDKSSGGWRKVSSKRMVRLQKLIARKKQEFTRLRQNAENYEKKSRILEASLRSARSAWSAERTRRDNAENELRELRIKFWELLALRKSQPWQNRKEAVVSVQYYEKPEKSQPSDVSEPTAVVENAKKTSPEPDNAEHTIKGSAESDVVEHVKKTSTESDVVVHMKRASTNSDLVKHVREVSTEQNSEENVKNTVVETAPEEQIIPRQAKCLPELEDSREPLTKSAPKSPEGGKHETAPKSTERSKPRKPAPKKDDVSTKHSTPPANRPTLPQAVPVIATAQINGVPIRMAEVKKTSCTSISFKKFLMPAMTALAETFGSSKSKSKTSTEESTPGGTDQSGKPSSSSSSGAFAKVTVSISASARPRSKPQKARSKSRGAKRSRSRGKEKSKPESAQQAESVKTPCQETFPGSSSDLTLCRRHSAEAAPPAPEYTEVLPSPILLPIPSDHSAERESDRMASDSPQDERQKGDKAPNQHTKWRPLNIFSNTGSDDIVDSGVTVPGTLPVDVSLAKHKAAGKGRSLSFADVTAGKFTRNQFAKALMSRAVDPLTLHDVRNTSSAVPDVIPRPGGASFGDGGDKAAVGLNLVGPATTNATATTTTVPRPDLSSPFSTLFRQAPSLTPITTPKHPAALPGLATSTTSTFLASFPRLTFPSPPSVVTAQPRPITSQSLKESVVHTQHQQQQSPGQQLTLPPRALHFDFLSVRGGDGGGGSGSDAVARQIRQGWCLTCGMRFSPTVDRYLVEEHIYFHHAFTE